MKIYCITQINNESNPEDCMGGERLFLNANKRDEEFLKLPTEDEYSLYYKVDRETED